MNYTIENDNDKISVAKLFKGNFFEYNDHVYMRGQYKEDDCIYLATKLSTGTVEMFAGEQKVVELEQANHVKFNR